MKKSMDLFGKALLDYSRGSKNKFYFIEGDGEKHEHPLRQYLKSRSLTRFEKKMVDLSYGDILDVGCGTGKYIPHLMKHGKVFGIDISSDAIRVARKNKIHNCTVADIFKFKTTKKFDTILLISNGLGMAETVPKTTKLLKILSKLLKKNGQIITTSRNVFGGKYHVAKLYPFYKNTKGKKFMWISFNSRFLSSLCNKAGLKLEVIDRGKRYYLARIAR